MTEKQLQHELVVWFSQKYPHLRGLLFEVNNDTYNVKHAMKRRAMGMIKGVSDLLFIMPKFGKAAGIELKAPGSKHGIDHIKNQLEWGETLIKNEGYYLITSDLELAKNFIGYLVIGGNVIAKDYQNISLKHVKEQFDKKTVKF